MLVFLEEKPQKQWSGTINIYIYSYKKYSSLNFPANTYREKAMKSGIYLGHHSGKPAKLYIEDKENIHLCAEDYNRVFWSYLIKYILTVFCLENRMLHLKAGAVEFEENIYLIMGRGGSGKTEIIKAMCNNGGTFITNTHAIIKANEIMGLSTNIRVREDDKQKYYMPNQLFPQNAIGTWKKVDKILWINHRNDGEIRVKKLKIGDLFYNIKQFSEAIANWELHEDIYDYYGSDPIGVSTAINDIDKNIMALISATDNYYVNADIFSEDGFRKLINLIK